jgi:hypothetical protein
MDSRVLAEESLWGLHRGFWEAESAVHVLLPDRFLFMLLEL